MIDAASIDTGTRLDADVCVVGSGPAALAVATRLLGSDASLIVLEAGYARYDRKVQADYRGHRVGDHMLPLHRSRARRYGGTGVEWAGRTRPLDAEDFESRSGIPGSGWPIGYADLEGYFREAVRFCRVALDDDAAWREQLPPEARFDGSDLLVRRLGCAAPLDFGEAYRPALDDAASVRLLVGASVVGLRASAGGERIERVEVARSDGGRFAVCARLVVLACGGIENARLLLASADVAPHGIGNQHDQVGRCFMEHPSVNAGLFLPGARRFPVELFRFGGPGAQKEAHGQICLDGAVRARESLPAAAACFTDAPPPYARTPAYGSAGVRAAQDVVGDLRRREWPWRAGRQARALLADAPRVASVGLRRMAARRRTEVGVRVILEQLPDPSNRVTLTSSRDRFGVPRAQLAWRIGDAEKRAYDRLCGRLAAHFESRGIGRFEFFEAGKSGGWPATLSAACHHMGTTRMATDPARGVVGADSRVHGVRNLYVAGSSVFATGGSANPTLTLVALSLRLGDEIARRLDEGIVVGAVTDA